MNLNQNWIDEFPKEIGYYWFFGEPYMGQMGKDYKEDYKPEFKLHVIQIIPVSNVLTPICGGQIIPRNSWNKKKEGWFGRWKKIETPNLPTME